jgi:cell division protein FtsW (lipid II flippase)
LPPDPDENWWWAREVGDRETKGNENEEIWYNKYAYQPAQALFGVSDGRLFGAGLGRGYPESVPIADSDFIYAAIAEEMGLAGGAVVIAAFIILVIAGMRTAIEARDMFTKLLAAGVTAFLGFQAIINIGGVIRMLPMTGITLPFVSHGGWSLITSFLMLGMLMAISHRNNRG